MKKIPSILIPHYQPSPSLALQSLRNFNLESFGAGKKAFVNSIGFVANWKKSPTEKGPCPTSKSKKPAGSVGGGLKWLIVKGLIAGGAVYGSALSGVWGSSEESRQLFDKIKTLALSQSNDGGSAAFKSSSEPGTNPIVYYEKCVDFVCEQLRKLPESDTYKRVGKFLEDWFNPPK